MQIFHAGRSIPRPTAGLHVLDRLDASGKPMLGRRMSHGDPALSKKVANTCHDAAPLIWLVSDSNGPEQCKDVRIAVGMSVCITLIASAADLHSVLWSLHKRCWTEASKLLAREA